jgi:hypothetical protein
LNIDFRPTASATQRFRLSVVVVGLGLLLAVSMANPYQAPPFGGHHYLHWLAGIITILGMVALFRRERGHIALASAVATVGALGFLLLSLLVGTLSAAAIKLFMYN